MFWFFSHLFIIIKILLPERNNILAKKKKIPIYYHNTLNMDTIDHLPSASVSLSPAVVHVRPFPWRPGGQGPQTKPAETWTLSKH